MPKKGGSRKLVDKGDGMEERFHVIGQGTSVTAGVVQLAVNPLLNDPLSIQANSFEYYRFTRLQFRLHPPASPIDMAAMFYSGIPDTAPATVAAVSNSDQSTFLSASSTLPSKWVKVPRQLLSGKQPWYKAVQGTPESVEEIQGYLLINTGATNGRNYTIEVSGICEFKGVTDSSTTPPMTGAVREVVVQQYQSKLEEHQRKRQELARIRNQQAAMLLLSANNTTGVPLTQQVGSPCVPGGK